MHLARSRHHLGRSSTDLGPARDRFFNAPGGRRGGGFAAHLVMTVKELCQTASRRLRLLRRPSARNVSSRLRAAARFARAAPGAAARRACPGRSTGRPARSRRCGRPCARRLRGCGVVMMTVPPAAAALAQHGLDLARRAGVEAGQKRLVEDDHLAGRAPARRRAPPSGACRLEKPSRRRSCACGVRPSHAISASAARSSAAARLDAPQAGDELPEVFERRQLVVDHRLVRHPRHRSAWRRPDRRARRCPTTR